MLHPVPRAKYNDFTDSIIRLIWYPANVLIKTNQDEIQNYLHDTSQMLGGNAAKVFFPETAEEISEILKQATQEKTPVTISGAGTGTVGGRVPFGGIVISTERLNRIIKVENQNTPHFALRTPHSFGVAQAGVILGDYQKAADAKGLLYPPDPTEWSCYLGGTVATNASGARTFKYGATRNYIRRLQLVLATGEILNLKRGEVFAEGRNLKLPLQNGRTIEAKLPSYKMPKVRKHASGYFIEENMDAIDLFIGSEGTLGVITEIETDLIQKPEGVLAGVVFFESEENLLAFVREARELSLNSRFSNIADCRLPIADLIFNDDLMRKPIGNAYNPQSAIRNPQSFDARALEFFDKESLGFLRTKYELVPSNTTGAIFFEQEITEETEENLMEQWLELIERHDALVDDSWFAVNEQDRQKIRAFRHQMPVLMNEWFSRYKQKKVSTDMAVPDNEFAAMLKFYQDSLRDCGLRYVIFGHIGDNHVHVNILPRDDEEGAKAREIYKTFIERAVRVGGTISAEHGIGKLKRDYLRVMYGDAHLREMAELKKAFDPVCILGRGNMFSEEFL
jgi:D-lactate dehydrogenase (cytochrome)